MTISKAKAKAKAIKLLDNVVLEMHNLSKKGFGYTNLMYVPSGRRLLRYSKHAGLKLRTSYMFGILRFVHFV